MMYDNEPLRKRYPFMVLCLLLKLAPEIQIRLDACGQNNTIVFYITWVCTHEITRVNVHGESLYLV